MHASTALGGGACPRCDRPLQPLDQALVCPAQCGRFLPAPEVNTRVFGALGVGRDMLDELLAHFAGKRLRCAGCGKGTVGLQLRGVALDWCEICCGMWFDRGELTRLTGAPEPELEHTTSASTPPVPVPASPGESSSSPASPDVPPDIHERALGGVFFAAGAFALAAQWQIQGSYRSSSGLRHYGRGVDFLDALMTWGVAAAIVVGGVLMVLSQHAIHVDSRTGMDGPTTAIGSALRSVGRTFMGPLNLLTGTTKHLYSLALQKVPVPGLPALIIGLLIFGFAIVSWGRALF